MANYYGRLRQWHGSYTNFDNYKSEMLADEFAIIDSGDPNTASGKAVYYKNAGGDIVRLVNAEELSTVKAVAIKVPDEIADNWSNVSDSYAAEEGSFANVYGDLYFLAQVQDNGGVMFYDWMWLPDETSNIFVPKTRRVAGLRLDHDISVAELKQALGLA